MGLTITSDLLDAARQAGACGEIDIYKPGDPIENIRQSDLDWFALTFPRHAKRLVAEALADAEIEAVGVPPAGMLSGSGHGYGYGDGYGHGHSSGHGHGYGYGDGYGSGYCESSGHGYGHGYGYGHGDGDGSGYMEFPARKGTFRK